MITNFEKERIDHDANLSLGAECHKAISAIFFGRVCHISCERVCVNGQHSFIVPIVVEEHYLLFILFILGVLFYFLQKQRAPGHSTQRGTRQR